jgi:signal transduction histidine kinase/CheY-like chemotaxis protein
MPSAPSARGNSPVDSALAAGVAPDVDTELLHQAFRRLPLSLAMTCVAALIVAGAMHWLLPSPQLLAWMAAIFAVTALRLLLWLGYRRAAPSRASANRWRFTYLAGALLAGLSWALGPMLMLPQTADAVTAMFAVTLLCVGAVGMTTQSSQKAAMQVFISAAILPVALVVWRAGGDTDRMLAVLLVAATGSLIIVGRRSSQATRELLEAQAQLRAAVDAASAARAHAESASHAKSRFLANMSHELRSPLNTVIGAGQLLQAGAGNAESQAQLVEAIQRSGSNLLGLIDNILDLSRIEAGEMSLVLEDFHLVDCIEAALATAAVAARAKGLLLSCIVDAGLPAWRRGDALRLRQVLLNLLGNAVKFTPAGEIVLRVEPGDEDGVLRITVADTGVGIGEASLPRVFDAFRQADDGPARRFGGSGLGLSIVRQLVEAMGGRIGVASTLGRGATFTLELVLPTATTPPQAAPPLGDHIAFFEPHEPSAQALLAQLQRLGCHVQRVHDSQGLQRWLAGDHQRDRHAWLLVANDHPQALRLLEDAADGLDPEHIIGMTRAETFDGDRARMQMKLPRNIIKPVLRSVLVSRLGVDRRHAPPPAVTVPAQLMTAEQLASTRHVLVVEDDTLNQIIVCRLLAHAGILSTSAGDGAQALALLAGHDFDMVLMDWQMPDMDGLEVTRRVRAGEAGPRSRDLPIVALTANAFAEDRAACLAAGMNDFLTKPVVASRLLAAVNRWCGPVPALPAAPAARPQALAKS